MVWQETEGVLVPLLVLLLLWVMLGYDGKEELVLVYVLLFPNLKETLMLVEGALMLGQETEGVLVPLLILLLLWVMLGYDEKKELVMVYVLLFPNLKETLMLVEGVLMVGQEPEGVLVPLLVLLLLWVMLEYDGKEELVLEEPVLV